MSLMYRRAKFKASVLLAARKVVCETARYAGGMNTNAEIRLHNFALLYAECVKIAGGERGAARKMHDLSGVPEPLISQIRNRTPHKSGVPRGIGSITARKLEAGFDKESGWMDKDHSKADDLEEADFLDLLRQIDRDQRPHLKGMMTGIVKAKAPQQPKKGEVKHDQEADVDDDPDGGGV